MPAAPQPLLGFLVSHGYKTPAVRAVVRDGGVPISPNSTVPATEQWVGELLASKKKAGHQPAFSPCACMTPLGYGSYRYTKARGNVQGASSSCLVCSALERFFLKSVDSVESFMSRPAMNIHQLFHQSIGPAGDALIQVGDNLMITGKRIQPKRSQLMRAELIHTSLNSGRVPLG